MVVMGRQVGIDQKIRLVIGWQGKEGVAGP